MVLAHTPNQNTKNMKLLGAIQISSNPFFVLKNETNQVVIKSSKEEGLQKCVLKNMIQSNPCIKKILNSHKIKLNIDTKALKDLALGHMNATCNIALGIFSQLPPELKQGLNENIIREAAMLHDLGKALIPPKILNKPSCLNSKERKIMNIHSVLGYELLKTQEIKTETLELIKYHHQNLAHSGYPEYDEGLHSDIGIQIISTADKYSALREARVYRKKMSRTDALLILYKEVREGKISSKVFDALINYLSL